MLKLNSLRYILIISLFLGLARSALGFEHAMAVADVNYLPLELNSFVYFIEDYQRNITFEQIASGALDDRWQRNNQRYFRGADRKARYWFRIEFDNFASIAKTEPKLYVPGHPILIYEVNLWLPQADGSFKEIETGFLRPFANRDMLIQQLAFDLPTHLNRFSVIGYIDSRFIAQHAMMPFVLLSKVQLKAANVEYLVIQLAFIAVMLALMIYNGCLAISLRQPLYIYYLLFLGAALSLCLYTGSWYLRWLWPDNPEINNQFNLLNGVFTILFYLIFIFEALDRLRFNRILRRLFYLLAFTSSIGITQVILGEPLFLVSIFNQIYSSAILIFTVTAIVMAIRHKVAGAHFLLIAEIFTIMGGTLFMLLIQGLVALNYVTFWSLHWGFLGEAIFLSLALADKTNRAIEAELAARQRAIESERKVQAAIQTATNAKNEFMRNVSHELRTPLTSIIGFSENVIDQQLVADAGKGDLRTILSSSKTLLRTIDDVFNLSLIDSKLVNITHRITHLNDLIYLIDIQSRAAAVKKSIEFQVNKDPLLPEWIVIDDIHLQQILYQLVHNAIKFTDQGKVSMQVSCDSVQHILKFDVSSSGAGVEQRELTSLFEPSSSSDTSDWDSYGGIGVGLFIARTFAELLGGGIQAENNPGGGNRFIFTLPYRRVRETDLPVTAEQLQSINTLDTTSSKNRLLSKSLSSKSLNSKIQGRVLLAEDNIDNQNLVCVLTKSLGAQIDIVSNGAEAVEAVLNAELNLKLNSANIRNYDLILMDIQMPIMDGVEATKKIKSAGINVPVIAFSASAIKGTTYDDVGFDGFLSKPIDKNKLHLLFRQYLQAID